jgi:crotonobetainyl-CoA hydratase
MSGTNAENVVLVERAGEVMIITINRPEARNAVNVPVHMAIGAAMQEADRDPGIRAVILTGAGELAFCAGADLRAASRGERVLPQEPEFHAWGFAGFCAHHISKPTIAAVNGFAMGGGCEVVLAADLVVAADTATFGLPEVKRGIIAGSGGVYRLPRQIPIKAAMEMILIGDPITAQRGLELGLVNRVVPREQVLDEALKMARQVAANAPLAVQASKRIARGIVDGQISAEIDVKALNDSEMHVVRRSEDAREGPLAFVQKRPPVWKAK